jgi:hypothetical protein
MTVIPIEIVITGPDPVIHLLRKKLLRRLMDARIKSGHDERVCCSIQFSDSQDASVVEPSFRDGPQDQTSDAQLRIGESRDSGFDAEPVIGPRFARTRWHRPGMTESRLLGGARHRARIRALYFLSCS